MVGAQMNPPKFEFILGKQGDVDEFVQIDAVPIDASVARSAPQLFFQGARFAPEVIPPLFRLQSGKVHQPIKKIPGKPGQEAWTPPRHPVITSIRSGGVNQTEEGDFLVAVKELTGHLISHDAAETVTAQIIWPFRLDAAQFLDVLR